MSDIYATITNHIIASLEKGDQPWLRPWKAGHPAGSIRRPLRADGIPYQGINTVMLWLAAAERGYTSPYWMTFKRAQELGGCVRKGETATPVVYASRFTAKDDDTEREIPFLKGYSAFNAEQIDDLPESFYAPVYNINPDERDTGAEAFFAATGARVRESDRALYNPAYDFIAMPPFRAFKDAGAYYATLSHEVIHWTGSKPRLNRDLSHRFGSSAYAMEELIAELGAAYLCADLGLSPQPRAEHTAYIACWLKVLRKDKKAIFTAASQAQRAADFLHKMQEQKAAA